MRALWITTSLCLASTAVLAQPASQTVVGLDTCFKLVRVAEANCSNSADDAAQRRACLQNARKVQLECLELAGPQASASVDRPQTAAGAVPSDRPADRFAGHCRRDQSGGKSGCRRLRGPEGERAGQNIGGGSFG